VRTISIDPLTRLEGHGRVEIFLDDEGKVANAYLQVPELRGFEQFCVGRMAENMPSLTSRICGLCPEAHLMASVKALDDLFMVTVPRPGRLIRELLYHAFIVMDHMTHFYALGGPDLLVGADAPAARRNLVGVITELGAAAGREIIACRRRNHELIARLGGRGVHGTGAVPGGWSKPLDEAGREEALAVARENVAFALTTLDLLDERVLRDGYWRTVLLGDTYVHRTYSMGTVDGEGRSDLFDGTIRVVDPAGAELTAYPAAEYTAHVAERVEPWTYMAFPYLREVGWKGFVDGAGSGVYTVGPLARLNAADGLSTPVAAEHFERYHRYFGTWRDGARPRPVHHRLATHWARLIEVLNSAEMMARLAADDEISSPRVRNLPTGDLNPSGGIGSVEAPRGTLVHHYEADGRGVLTSVNMVVGTTNNHAAMAMSVARAARSLINGADDVDDGLLNQVEMSLRLYDPCLSCATHSLPGRMPLVVSLRDARGTLLRELRRQGR
jgi:F420-non-reducing hydrogenase large subunit